ncbi:MAG TPA: hypothetical protein PLL69_08745 [Gemmatimonadales bacterium]|nr:hypothetical protein [Gemmatimonadales bacterium]
MLLLVGAGDASAQRIAAQRAGFAHSEFRMTPLSAASMAETSLRRHTATHWKTGALITGIPAVIMFNLVAVGDDMTLFQQTAGRVASSALVGAVFAVPGAVVGGLFPKARPRSSSAQNEPPQDPL